jgi:hypothetical protein
MGDYNKTTQEWFDEMVVEKETMSSLDSLTTGVDDAQEFITQAQTPSQVAIWQTLVWICASAGAAFQNTALVIKESIEAILKDQKPGTIAWYVRKAKEFQYGDSLTWNAVTEVWEYSVIDEAAMIVTHASVLEGQNAVRLKVAKTVSNVLAPLTVGEKNALAVYMKQIKFAGTKLLITSADPDLLKITATCIYDPLVLNPDGTLISDNVTRPVDVAIQNYIENLPFDGRFTITKLEDAVQAALGVVDWEATTVEKKYGALDYSTVDLETFPDAGYFKIDALFPLSTTITYQANV